MAVKDNMSLWQKMKSFVENVTNQMSYTDTELLENIRKRTIDVDRLLLKAGDTYFNKEELQKINSDFASLYEAAKANTGKTSLFKRQIRGECEDFVNRYNAILSTAQETKRKITERNIELARKEILPVEGKQLDYQQLSAIVKNEPNHLILAGAGTGKTTTVVGYIKWLTLCRNVKPSDILVLSFTNASAAEMSERIESEIGCRLDASTFHKLGMNIIAAVEKKKPTVYSGNLNQFIRNNIKELAKEKQYFAKLCSYLVFYSNDKSDFEFQTVQEYNAYLNANPPTTLKGEIVKSYGEVQIANFLMVNGIRYEYESSYRFDTADIEHSQYKPDFYLPDYDLYIEYFGIDRNGRVAKYFKDRDGISASEYYNKSIQWKRETHRRNHTKMIELYAYEHFENTLLSSLSSHLKENNVEFRPMPMEEIWNLTGRDNLDRFVELFSTVINLMKNNDIDFNGLRSRNNSLLRPLKLDIIIDLIEPLYAKYEEMLKERKEIDFNDMINLATQYVISNRYIHHYDYVIVDEYQDIAQSRYKLLYAMRQQKNYNLFCVGDDWQSIYRFSGSDIGFILDFEKYWGPTEIDKIETTYRFSRSLIALSGEFIMRNPKQIRKSLISGLPRDIGFSAEEIQGYSEKYAIEYLENKLNDLPKEASVLLLGRYNFDLNLLKLGKLKYQFDNSDKKIHVSYYKRPDLDIVFMTAHSSKGLQADYVFILNNKNLGMGFPSKISDAPILKLLLDDTDNYPFGEERRLFYVAMTRAKKKAFFVTVKGNESVFIKEIKREFGKEMKNEQYRCPVCGGRLIIKSGPYGDFFGCENYRTTGCKYIRKINKKAAKNGQ